MVDNNGVWICTGNGLVNYNNDGFKAITTLDEKSDGLTGLYGTTSISKSRDGIYFIGSEGVRMYDPNSLRIITVYEGMPIPNNWTNGIHDLKLDKDGYLWAASGWNGIYKLSGEIILENFNTDNSNIPANKSLNIAFAKDGSMWCTHADSGLSRYINGEFERSAIFEEPQSITTARPIPIFLSFHTKKYIYQADFDEMEMMEAFEKLGANNKVVIMEIDPHFPRSSSKVRLYNDEESIELKKAVFDDW